MSHRVLAPHERVQAARDLREAASTEEAAASWENHAGADALDRMSELEAEAESLRDQVKILTDKLDEHEAVLTLAARSCAWYGYAGKDDKRHANDPVGFMDSMLDEIASLVRDIGRAHRTGTAIDPDDLALADEIGARLDAADAAHRLAR